MTFSQKEYVFSHTMAKVSQAHQPALFKVDLHSLIPFGGQCSPLFVVENMSVTAYKQGTLEKIPVHFTVLSDNKRRVLTNDPCKLSSKWKVELDCGSCMKIAGTDTVPFMRTLPVYEEENRQALVNALAFMMSNSLWASDRARGALDVVTESTRGEFHFTCELCLDRGVACVTKGPSGHPLFSFCQCGDGYLCIPSAQPCADEDYKALRKLMDLLRCASVDNLGILKRITQEMASDRTFQDLDCGVFPPRHMYMGNILIPYALMKYIISLYQTMSEYVDNFAVIDEKTPHVQVLIESPSENIGVITGQMALTVIYGAALSTIYSKLNHGSQYLEGCQGHEQVKSLANITQLTSDVLIRRTPLNFTLNNHMSLKDWYEFYYG